MIPFKGIISCAIALLFTAALYAGEKPAAQSATTQVATAAKSKSATESKKPTEKKCGDVMEAHHKKMAHMHEGMCMCTKMEATSDGGVIILMGNRLLKYDANLKLVKEAEIKPAAEVSKKAVKPKAPEAKAVAPKSAPADAKK